MYEGNGCNVRHDHQKSEVFRRSVRREAGESEEQGDPDVGTPRLHLHHLLAAIPHHTPDQDKGSALHAGNMLIHSKQV